MLALEWMMWWEVTKINMLLGVGISCAFAFLALLIAASKAQR